MSGLLRQSAAVLALNWLVVPFGMVTAVLVARAVGPEGKGVLFLLTALTALMTGLSSLGIGSAAAFLYKQGRLTAEEIVGSTGVLSAVALLFLALGYWLFADDFLRIFLGKTASLSAHPKWVVLALVPVLPAGVLAVADVLLIANHSMGAYAMKVVGGPVVTLAMTWYFTLRLGWGVDGVLWAQALGSTFSLLSVFAAWSVSKRRLSGLSFSVAGSLELLRIGWQQYVTSLVSLLTRRFDGFFVANVLSVKDAGYYSVANSVNNMLLTLPRASAWPLATRLGGAQDPAVLLRVCRLQFLLMAIVCAVLIPAAPTVVTAMFGARFDEASTPLRWALVGVPFAPLALSVSAFLTARGKLKHSVAPMMVSGALQVGLNVVLVPPYGASGSAVALSAQLVCFAFLQLHAARELRAFRLYEFFVPVRDDFLLVLHALRRSRVPKPASESTEGAER